MLRQHVTELVHWNPYQVVEAVASADRLDLWLQEGKPNI